MSSFRSVVVVSGPSRTAWFHSIRRKHIRQRRVAVTMRELSPLFQPGGEQEEVGKKVLAIANTFKGRPVNFV